MERIEVANTADCEALAQLVNSAYRGESGRQGWTTEADLIDGTRTDAEMIKETMKKPGFQIMKHLTNGEISGCVELGFEDKRMYLGMLTVRPGLQNAGIGKKLMQYAEHAATEAGCTAIYMTVITDRTELIDWYTRQGYRDTGERKAFAFNDIRNGIPRKPLTFMVLQKKL
jgi:ribosomal protein S18 acetylase RimI-like enzyme